MAVRGSLNIMRYGPLIGRSDGRRRVSVYARAYSVEGALAVIPGEARRSTSDWMRLSHFWIEARGKSALRRKR